MTTTTDADAVGVPLELVRYNAQSGQFEVGQPAAAALRKVQGPIGVVAVSGRARQGKSFILNQLLQQSTGGFTVGPTHRPCTKGLWMWSAPVRRTAADGSEYHLVLTDTEGTDAFDQTAQYSTQIFSLAVLLSSLFVYNQMGGIDESAIDRLSLVTEMTKHIRVCAGSDGQEQLADFTPSFLWLLRDFYLKLEEEEGQKITAKDYLEAALMPVAGSGPAVTAKNQIRASIKSLFPDRDCFTLLRPMHDEAALCDLNRVPPDQLRPEFRKGVAKLMSLIFSRAQPKRFGSQVVTGPVLAGLLDAYVAAINQGAVPTIATAWQGVAESECRRAADAAEAAYATAFNPQVAAEEGVLDLEHARCVGLGRAAFARIAVGDKTIRDAHETRFLQAAAARFAEVRGRKLAEAAAIVNDLLYQAAVNVAQAARKGSTLIEMQSELEAFAGLYRRQASGPSKWERLADFLLHMYPVIAGEVLQRAESAAQACQHELDQELRRIRETAGQQQRHMEQVQAEAADLAVQLEHKAMEEEARAAELERSSHDLSSALCQLAEARAVAEQHSGRAATLAQQLRDNAVLAERKISSAEEQAEILIHSAAKQHHEQLADLEAKLVSAQQLHATAICEVSALEARMAGMDAELISRGKESDTWRSKFLVEFQEKLQLIGEKDKAQDLCVALAHERDLMRHERDVVALRLASAVTQLETEHQRTAIVEARMMALAREAEAARAHMLQHDSSAELVATPTGVESPLSHASSAPASPAHMDGLEQLTVGELCDWLTQHGLEQDVWRLQAQGTQRPPPRKADWLQLARAFQDESDHMAAV